MIGHSESQTGTPQIFASVRCFHTRQCKVGVFPDGGDRLGVTAGLSDYNTVELPSCNLPQAFFLSVSVRRQTAAFFMLLSRTSFGRRAAFSSSPKMCSYCGITGSFVSNTRSDGFST
mgnify:FL=1